MHKNCDICTLQIKLFHCSSSAADLPPSAATRMQTTAAKPNSNNNSSETISCCCCAKINLTAREADREKGREREGEIGAESRQVLACFIFLFTVKSFLTTITKQKAVSTSTSTLTPTHGRMISRMKKLHTLTDTQTHMCKAAYIFSSCGDRRVVVSDVDVRPPLPPLLLLLPPLALPLPLLLLLDAFDGVGSGSNGASISNSVRKRTTTQTGSPPSQSESASASARERQGERASELWPRFPHEYFAVLFFLSTIFVVSLLYFF